MNERVFGPITGVETGTSFMDRQAAHDAGVHRPTQAGISGAAAEGADSIVVSGGYEDDEDYGDVIIYTGHGGRDPDSGEQVADQTLTRQNLALARSADEGLPIRVVRGSSGDPTHSPASGYRYDGIYSIERYWSEVGRSGHRVWRFRLVAEGEPPAETSSQIDVGAADRVEATAQRIVRNTEVAQRVKGLHGHVCQVCGVRVMTPSGPYAEGAHIRPLGRPHDGPDVPGNLLCLCPNDHVRFDRGAIIIDDKARIIGMDGSQQGQLRSLDGHGVDDEFLAYHRALFSSDDPVEMGP